MNKLADAVRVTLGPKGRNVVLEKKWGAPTITNDGVSIAKEIDLEDPYEKVGAELVKEVAKKTDDVAGDGTTTATVLAWAMVREGLRNVAAGANPMVLKVGIEKAVETAVESIKKDSKSVKTDHAQIANVAAISAADKEIGEMIAESLEKVGTDGVITVEESQTFGMELDLVEGMRFDKGYISPYFVTDTDRMEAVLDDAYILLVSQQDLGGQGPPPRAREGHAVEPSARDHRRGRRGRGARHARRQQDPRHVQVGRHQGPRLRRAPQGDAPGHGDPHRRPGHLRGDRPQAREHRPRAARSRPQGRRHQGRDHDRRGRRRPRPTSTAASHQIRTEIENTDSDYDREKLQERLAKLAGGVAIIKVGAATEVELKEKKHRIEDAVQTTKAAVEEGVVPGGGVALLRAQEKVLELADHARR